MAELKTKVNDADVNAFIQAVENVRRREDAFTLLEMMNRITGEAPKMWGDTMVGYGSYHYVYSSGQTGDWMRMGFSPRKANLSIYILDGYAGPEPLLEKLGKHKTGVGCLYVNKLADIDLSILEQLIQIAWNRPIMNDE